MKLSLIAAIAVSIGPIALAQISQPYSLSPGTTLPVRFDKTIDPAQVHPGDTFFAKTAQVVRLSNGKMLPAGSRVNGQIVTVSPFAFDKTPYAKQKASILAIRFDSVQNKDVRIPLHVYVRAMADPFVVRDAELPKSTDLDPLSTTTQIGGDQVVPSQSEVLAREGDIVGYQRRGGVYAHLISAVGKGPTECDGSDTEQSMGLFSAAACGLYGYTDATLVTNGKAGEPSILTLSSRRRSAKIWANSEVLLEVFGEGLKMVSE
jgi:hypothetical protein